MDNSEELDLFSFMQPEKVAEKVPAPAGKFPLSRQELQQLALGFLSSLNPDAAAMNVPARFRKYQVTCAGFWRGTGKAQHDVVKTAVVVLYEKFERCFNDCANRDKLLESLHELRAERERLEAEIRINEPELASQDDLFSELRSWDYASSTNAAYHKLRRKMTKVQDALHQGSRLCRIHGTGVADHCYLAVPAGLVQPDEIALSWGLVYLGPERKFELVKEPEQLEAQPQGRQLLAQNIAIAARSAVRFAAGVDTNGKKITYRKPPRKRKKLGL